jgi:hypothetical protein
MAATNIENALLDFAMMLRKVASQTQPLSGNLIERYTHHPTGRNLTMIHENGMSFCAQAVYNLWNK